LGKSLRNDVVRVLINGHLYCQTCKNIYSEYNVVYDSIESVLQMLSRYIYWKTLFVVVDF
jgi:hypothetical protein